MASLRQRYTTQQVTLHWLIVGLVAFQFFTGEGMSHAFDAVYEGTGPWTGNAFIHGFLGSCILLFMLARLALRARVGAPPPPASEPDNLQKVSRGVHFAFYALLIGMPIAGLIAVFTGIGWIAWVHGLTSKLVLALIAAHVAGAIWHATKRDGTLSRILPIDRAS